MEDLPGLIFSCLVNYAVAMQPSERRIAFHRRGPPSCNRLIFPGKRPDRLRGRLRDTQGDQGGAVPEPHPAPTLLFAARSNLILVGAGSTSFLSLFEQSLKTQALWIRGSRKTPEPLRKLSGGFHQLEVQPALRRRMVGERGCQGQAAGGGQAARDDEGARAGQVRAGREGGERVTLSAVTHQCRLHQPKKPPKGWHPLYAIRFSLTK